MNMVDTIDNAALEDWLSDKEIEFIASNADQRADVLDGAVTVFSFSDENKFSGIKVLKLNKDLTAEEASRIEPFAQDINIYHATKGIYIGGSGAKNNDFLLSLIKFLAQKDLAAASKMHSDYLHFGSLTEEFEDDEENHRFFLEAHAIYEFVSHLDSQQLVLFAGGVELRVTNSTLFLWDKTEHKFFVFNFSAEDCNVYLRDMQEYPACPVADWNAIGSSVTDFDKIGRFQGAKTVGATKEFYAYLETLQCLIVDYLISNKCIENIVYFHDEDENYLEEPEGLDLIPEEDSDANAYL